MCTPKPYRRIPPRIGPAVMLINLVVDMLRLKEEALERLLAL
jgi:hypothetical protein